MSVARTFPRSTALATLMAAVLTPAVPAAAQGWIEPTVPGSGSVERVESQVRVRVDGPVAVVEVDEWFVNRGGRVAEGDYLYPLPSDAALSGVSLFQGDRELRGEIMDADEARDIYEEIVRRRRDPALVEYLGEGLFRARVFPIEPGQRRRVSLRYSQVLPAAGRSFHFRHLGATRGAHELAREIERRPDGAPGMAPVHVEITVTPADDFLTPFSPTHELDSERRGESLVVRSVGNVAGRLSVFLPRSGDAAGLTVLTHRTDEEDGFVLLSLTPPDAPVLREPRDVVVVVDVSGSMAGEKIDQARRAVSDLVRELGTADRFRLVAFSNAVQSRDADWTRATERARGEAVRWVEGLRADGGTNLDGALEEAFRVRPAEGRLPVVVFVTDGLPTVGERDPRRIAADAEAERGDFRVFAFGVGHDVNTVLLDRISAATRGTTQYVEPGEDVERALSLLASRIRHPVLTDLTLEGAPVRLTELYPVHIPDVFAGESLVLLARYRGTGAGDVVVEGRQAGQRVRVAARGDFRGRETGNEALPRLWAARKIGHLTRQLWVEGRTDGLVEEIRRTALRYGLPSPFTSILVEEPQMVTVAAGIPGRQPSPGTPVTLAPATLAPATFEDGAARVAAQSTGEAAVKMAEAARRMREVARVADMDAAEAESEDRVGGVRTLSGRVFTFQDGVWREAGLDDRARRVEIRRFSPAWFGLLEAAPELADAVRRLGEVELAGQGLRLRLGPTGRQDWDPGELERVVAALRRAAR